MLPRPAISPPVIDDAPAAARAASKAGAHQQAVDAFETVMPHAERMPVLERADLLDDDAWELHIAYRSFEAIQVGEEPIKLREEVGELANWPDLAARIP
ncbi:hypothetical protein [Kribbella sp. CA-294648]|uniref:hypothetical protein n=1 Tax=Kribbella sp. CA-294648 TaxID=3239948 RepID=UPI003D913A24